MAKETKKEQARRERAERLAELGSEKAAILAAADLQGVKDAVARLGQYDKNALAHVFKQSMDRIVNATLAAF